MQREADEFMRKVGLVYEGNKRKWASLLHKQSLQFNEDIYNDSIIKTYDAILKKEVDADYMGYWYRTFLNNTKRDTKYAYHNRDEGVDVIDYLKDREYEEASDWETIIGGIVCTLSDRELILIRMHYELRIPYEAIEEMTGVKDVRRYLKRLLCRMNKELE